MRYLRPPPPSTRESAQGEAVALRYALQSQARRLLPWHRVAMCLRARVTGPQGVEWWHPSATARAPASPGFGSM